MAETKQEVMVDFEGTAQSAVKKTLIQEDSYPGEIISVELIEVPNYEDKNKADKKLIFQVKLAGEGTLGAILPLYVNPTIKKSGGKAGYSNSKLYDMLDKAGELEAAKSRRAELVKLDGLLAFLSEKFVGKKVKALVKTRNKGKEGAYSTIADILRFE